jgi:energy-coupling factor transporter ATP-binding protein EcfA2
LETRPAVARKPLPATAPKNMLTKIHIKNYRCYDEHEIDFRRVTVIVGKNNAGKSTLVESLRLVALALSRFPVVNYHPAPPWTDLPIRARGISPSLKAFGLNTENLFHNYGDPPGVITASFSEGISVRIFIGENADIFCLLLDQNGESITTKGAAIQLTIPQVNILPQISPIQRDEKVLNRDYVRQNLTTDLASLHFRNQLSILYENFPKFRQLAEQSWRNLRVRELEGRQGMSGDKLTLLVQDGGFVSEIGWMGSGLQMWLQIMWFLARVNPDETIILDEPDVYMHPDLQRKLIRLLKNTFNQVIVSTHSIEIISEVEPSNILIIDKEKNKSLFATKVPVVQRILNSIGSIHNLQLTKLWSSKKLLIVEGEDVGILKRLQNILFPQSDDPFDSIPNFDIGGWGGWNYARGSSLLLKGTVDKEVKIYSIFDCDYHTESEIQAREKEAKEAGVNIHIWKRKEIENYLVVPTAILRIIKEGNRKASHLSVADVEKAIADILASMKEDLIDKLADAIQVSERKHKVSSARKLAKERIDKLEHRVCGKDLISEISKWSQSNFKVSLNPIKLALNLQEPEIESELKAVITAIEKCTDFKT